MNAHQLAKDFAAYLRSALTTAQLAEVVRANIAEADRTICHSHDVCDANVHMIEALADQNYTFTGTDSMGMNWAIDDAWEIAKFCDFDEARIEACIAQLVAIDKHHDTGLTEHQQEAATLARISRVWVDALGNLNRFDPAVNG